MLKGSNKDLKIKYEKHLLENQLSREEKDNDKKNVIDNFFVACYDLQAVLQLPKGEVSNFYYKSEINCYNFTVTELGKDVCECFVWNEVEEMRGAVMWLLTFYSDNCCGQNKNSSCFRY